MATLVDVRNQATVTVVSDAPITKGDSVLEAALDAVWEFVHLSPLSALSFVKTNGFYTMTVMDTASRSVTHSIKIDSPVSYQLLVTTTNYFPSTYFMRLRLVREGLLVAIRTLGITSLTIAWA